ncbi:MAG: HAD family hydrolase, partial [Bacteroidetes bacterium]|nr:HAD family hydrolase [Bacteroidota bacterium]
MKEQKQNLRDYRFDKRWTLFLDRDGVINRNIDGDYVRSIDRLELLPGVEKAIAGLTGIFGRTIIITNQRGVAKGLISMEDLEGIHSHLRNHLIEQGGFIDGIYYCPHDIDENCDCRKPKPGMVYNATMDFPDIEIKYSVLIGDKASDIELGNSLGMITVLVSS